MKLELAVEDAAVSVNPGLEGLELLANEPPGWVPPTWVLLLAFLFLAGTGCLSLMLGRYWAKRHREGTGPVSQSIWAGTYTAPHHPEDGIFFGWFYLGLAVIVLGGLMTRLLGLW